MPNSIYGPANRPILDPPPRRPGPLYMPVQEIRWSYPGPIDDEALLAGGLGPVWYPFSAINLVSFMGTLTANTMTGGAYIDLSLADADGLIFATLRMVAGDLFKAADLLPHSTGGFAATAVGSGASGTNLALILRYRYGTKLNPEVS